MQHAICCATSRACCKDRWLRGYGLVGTRGRAFNEGMKSLLRASGRQQCCPPRAGSKVLSAAIDVQVESLAAGIRGVKHAWDKRRCQAVHFMGTLRTAESDEQQALLHDITPAAFEVHRKAYPRRSFPILRWGTRRSPHPPCLVRQLRPSARSSH